MKNGEAVDQRRRREIFIFGGVEFGDGVDELVIVVVVG